MTESNCVKKQKAFNDISKHFNSIYDAVFYVGHKAHAYANKTNNAISHSEAITAVLFNNTDINVKQVKSSKVKLPWYMSYIDMRLSTVSDDIVRICATQSIVESVKHNYLIYLYKDGMSLEQMSRVRVLTNMIFDDIHTMQYSEVR